MNVIELGATSLSILVLGSLMVAGTAGVRDGAADPRLLLDQQHQKSIHQAMVTFGERNADGALPMPGRINRYTSSFLGRQPGVGPQNFKKDSTGHLFSAMIAQEYLDSKVVISPGERNPVVSEFGSASSDAYEEYDYESYDPATDVYWMGDEADPISVPPGAQVLGDPNQIFRAKINRPPGAGRGHVSYAHLMLAGQRRLDWNVKASSERVLFGTRGPKNGAATGDEFQRSQTLLFFGERDAWVGNVVRGDGRVERLEQREVDEPGTAPTFGFRDLVFRCGADRPRPDNIFAAEFAACGTTFSSWNMRDGWLAMSEIVIGDADGNPKPLAVYDWLRD